MKSPRSGLLTHFCNRSRGCAQRIVHFFAEFIVKGVIYRNNVKNRLLTASIFFHNSCFHSSLMHPQKNAACISARSTAKISQMSGRWLRFCSILFTILLSTVEGATIAEKMNQSLSRIADDRVNIDTLLKDVNEQLEQFRIELDACYAKARMLYQNQAQEEEFQIVLSEINDIRRAMRAVHETWHEVITSDSKKDEEGYALWDQQETTLAQLVMEYGAQEYLYIVPPEMGALKLNMHSNIPIPRESWGEVLEIILAHNGIGIKKINPYARQLYVLKQDPSAIQAIASSLSELMMVPDQTRLFYVFSPAVEQIKSAFHLLERFADPKQTFLYQVGPKIAIVSSKEEVQKLLNLYNSVWQGERGKMSKVVPVTKMSVKEMEKILSSFFGEAMEKNRPPQFGKMDQEGLTLFSLSQGNALVLIGSQEVVDRAEHIVRETEEQLQDPAEMTVSIYHCKHSNPEDLSKVLEKVYNSLLLASTETNKEIDVSFASQGPQFKTPPAEGYPPSAQVPPLVVSPPPLKIGSTATLEIEKGSDHFIPDLKTGNLLMVVRRDVLGKIKDLLRTLDVPKKMVQIEVLLFEKRIRNETNYGMNLLKLGSKKNGIQYSSAILPNTQPGVAIPGVLEFLLHGDSSKHFPAYDLIYTFMMTQEDIQLNTAPSVTTVNQTPATITIVEEISINNGAAPVNTNNGTISFQNSFSRANYGTIINVTPTVHVSDDETSEGKGFVTLQTNVTFDTTRHASNNDRPDVDRRHIENEVRVSDGQTVILGGLRKKQSNDKEEKIPFLGDIPLFGKLFGSSKLSTHNTEMFIFITPKIILDPYEELIQIRTEELKKRPGDIPEYLERVVESMDKERRKYFNQSMKQFFTVGR